MFLLDYGQISSRIHTSVGFSTFELSTIKCCKVLNGTYTGAQIKYTNGNDNKEIMLFVGEGNRILNISEKVDSLADAQLKICAKVNQENRKAETLTGTIAGDFRIIAGTCIEITDAFIANGKYFVDKVTHHIKDKEFYVMDLELHKVQPKISF